VSLQPEAIFLLYLAVTECQDKVPIILSFGDSSAQARPSRAQIRRDFNCLYYVTLVRKLIEPLGVSTDIIMLSLGGEECGKETLIMELPPLN